MKRPEECESIHEIRAAIDHLDHEIVGLLGSRFQYVQSIMRFKQSDEEILAPERYAAVLAQRRIWAAEAGLDPDLIESVYRTLMAHFIEEERRILRREPRPQ